MTDSYNSTSYVVDVVPSERILCSKLVKEVLSTHNNLQYINIEWASTVISRCNNGDLSIDENRSQMALFLLHSNKETNIGRFSLCFNTVLDDIIENRSESKLLSMLNSNYKDAFMELHDNNDLTKTEKESIMKMYYRERVVTLNVIEESLGKSSPDIDLRDLMVCPSEKMYLEANDGDNYSETSIYSKCYEGVCIYEQREEKSQDFHFKTGSKPPSIIFAAEMSESNMKNAYCFDFMTLIDAISKDPAINPSTNKPFRDETVGMLRARYHKEICMYQYFLNKIY